MSFSVAPFYYFSYLLDFPKYCIFKDLAAVKWTRRHKVSPPSEWMDRATSAWLTVRGNKTKPGSFFRS